MGKGRIGPNRAHKPNTFQSPVVQTQKHRESKVASNTGDQADGQKERQPIERERRLPRAGPTGGQRPKRDCQQDTDMGDDRGAAAGAGAARGKNAQTLRQ